MTYPEPTTDEHRKKISNALINGFVFHHYIYDHSDLSKYTTKMTRSRHTWLHNLMRRVGIIVPHINIKETGDGTP